MLIQRAGISAMPPSPPAWITGPTTLATPLIPDASTASRRSPRENLLPLNEQEFSIGHDDFEADDAETPLLGTTSMMVEKHEFGWDNEHPRRQVSIDRPVLVEKLCITNAEYLSYFRVSRKENKIQVPTSWMMDEDSEVEFKVH